MADAEIEDVRKRMTDAARADSAARRENQPAMHKLKMLPEVVSLLNRNQFMNSLVDPEINLLEAVKFFLEPLEDGSLPAYSIQRDLIAALGNLPINKDSLIASGIGKVIVFYTKSKRPEPGIKRQAERLLAEWTRPILQRSDDYSKRIYQEVEFDPTYVLLIPIVIYSMDNIANPFLQQTWSSAPGSFRSRYCRRSTCARAPATASGQPCACRNQPHFVHDRAALDHRPGKQVRASLGC